MAILTEEIDQQVPDHGTDIEPHRSVERELGVDDPGVAFRDHDRTCMKISVHKCLGQTHEPELQSRYRELERCVTAEFRGDPVQLRRRPAIPFLDHVGIGKDEIFRDLAEFRVCGEHAHRFLLLGRRQVQIRSEEQAARAVLRHVAGEVRVSDPLDHPSAHDDVR